MRTSVFNFLTRKNLKDESIAESFFDCFRRFLPRVAPTKCGDVEPLKCLLPQELPRACELWLNGLFWRSKAGRGYGRVLHGTRRRHSSLKMYFEGTAESENDLNNFFKSVSEIFAVDYSTLHHFDGKASRSEEEQILEGITSHDIQDWLPTVPYAACYGAPYIKLFGRKNLEVPVLFQHIVINEDLIFCQLVSDADAYLTDYSAFEERRELVKTKMGRSYFFDSKTPNSKKETPDFGF